MLVSNLPLKPLYGEVRRHQPAFPARRFD